MISKALGGIATTKTLNPKPQTQIARGESKHTGSAAAAAQTEEGVTGEGLLAGGGRGPAVARERRVYATAAGQGLYNICACMSCVMNPSAEYSIPLYSQGWRGAERGGAERSIFSGCVQDCALCRQSCYGPTDLPGGVPQPPLTPMTTSEEVATQALHRLLRKDRQTARSMHERQSNQRPENTRNRRRRVAAGSRP
jgi:hypothetical protein